MKFKLRPLLCYQVFGPYHQARWRHFSSYAASLGWEPLGLQLFLGSDLYNWQSWDSGFRSITELNLKTNDYDNIKWKDAPRFMRALESSQANVIIINGWASREALLSHLWCRLRGVHCVVVSDSQEIDSVRTGLKEGLKKILLRGIGSAFVAGEPQSRYVRKLGVPENKIAVGCDVVDNAHFKKAIGLRQVSGYRILTVARLAEQKNLIAAAHAFLRFVAERTGNEAWSWIIAGYGPQERKIIEIAEASQGRITLLGAVDYDDLPATYASADLYWQPSRWEPWGLAVNEAMASGLPVLVSDRCGCREDLVTAVTGWSFDPFDEDDMVRALSRAAKAHADWPSMGRAAANHIENWGLQRFTKGLVHAVQLAIQPGLAG